MTKRQSTTARITRRIAGLIGSDCERGNGVVIRYRGQEFGIIGIRRTTDLHDKPVTFLVCHETDLLVVSPTDLREVPKLIDSRECTILKATVAAMEQPKHLTINVGTTSERHSTVYSDDRVRAEIGWACIYPITVDAVFRASEGQWEGVAERTVIASGDTDLTLDEVLERLVEVCGYLGQDCIAYEFDGIGGLVWHDGATEDYSFDVSQFTR